MLYGITNSNSVLKCRNRFTLCLFKVQLELFEIHHTEIRGGDREVGVAGRISKAESTTKEILR